MNKDYKKLSKTLVLIPIIVTVVLIVCGVIASVLEIPTDRGFIYTVFASIAILGLFLAPLPCFISSVVGTVFAIKGKVHSTTVIGIIEILLGIVVLIFVSILFVQGQSV